MFKKKTLILFMALAMILSFINGKEIKSEAGTASMETKWYKSTGSGFTVYVRNSSNVTLGRLYITTTESGAKAVFTNTGVSCQYPGSVTYAKHASNCSGTGQANWSGNTQTAICKQPVEPTSAYGKVYMVYKISN